MCCCHVLLSYVLCQHHPFPFHNQSDTNSEFSWVPPLPLLLPTLSHPLFPAFLSSFTHLPLPSSSPLLPALRSLPLFHHRLLILTPGTPSTLPTIFRLTFC